MEKSDLEKLSKKELLHIIENLQSKMNIGLQSLDSYCVDYRVLLEETSDIIFVVDKNENLIYRNSAWKKLYPLMPDDMLGYHYLNYLPEHEKERAAHVITTVLKEGKVFKNEIMKTHNSEGEVIYLSASFSPIKSEDGEISGLIGIMKNVTDSYKSQKQLYEHAKILEERAVEHIKHEEEIKELRDLNYELISNAPIGIFMMDPSGVMLSENDALKTMMGRPLDETIVGVNLLNHSGFVESGFVELFEKCKLEKKTVKVYNRRYMPISGFKELIINVTMDPILNSRGIVEKIIVMIDDNTEQAMITERYQRAEKYSAIGVLASGVASELKGPINKMTMDLNFVYKNIDKESPAAEYLDSMKSSLKKIKSMAEQLLMLSRPDEEDKEIVEINKLLTSHPLDVLLARLKEEGFEIEIDFAEDNPAVKATYEQLYSVFNELIVNAEEAMPDKGRIKISIKTYKTDEGPYVFVTITDSGIGMPEENIKKIFQPFFTTKGNEATGLGLLTAANVIENLGGSIGVKSAPGEGTSVKIALPVYIQNNH